MRIYALMGQMAPYASYILFGIRTVLMILIALGVYNIFSYLERYHVIRRGMEAMYSRIVTAASLRSGEEKELRALYGNADSRNFLTDLDDAIRYSGIVSRFPFITTELYLAGMVLVMLAAFITGSLITGKWYFSLICIPAVYVLSELFLNRLRKKRYELVEEGLLPLINSVENYAAGSDDIIYILEMSVSVLEGPIKDEIYTAITRARSSGRSSEALRILEDDIEHPFFKTFIRNLEIASRNSSNYADIVTECRALLTTHLDNSRTLGNIYRKAQMTMLGIICFSVLGLILTATMVLGCSTKELFGMYNSTLPGRLLLITASAVLVISLYYAVIKNQKRG